MDELQLPDLINVDEINTYYINHELIKEPVSHPCIPYNISTSESKDVAHEGSHKNTLNKCSLYIPTSLPVMENQEEWMISRGYTFIPETRRDKINRYLRKRARRTMVRKQKYQNRIIIANMRKRCMGRFVSTSIFRDQ